MKISGKHLLVLCVLLVFVAACVAAYLFWQSVKKTSSRCPRCNVIMIDIDILRADALPCYGYKRNTAPNICAFAQKATVFTNNFTQSNWTLPAMFSTITSLYPSQHGVTASMRDSLNPEVQTLAQTFKGEGYNTYYFGSLGSSVINDTNGGTKGYDFVKYVKPDEWMSVVQNIASSADPFFIHFYNNSLHMPYILESQSQIMEPAVRPLGFPVTKNDFLLLLGHHLLHNQSALFSSQAIKERPGLFNNQNTSSVAALVEYYWSLYKSTDPDLINSEGWRVVYELFIKTIKEGGEKNGEYARLQYDSALSLLDKKLNPLFNLFNSATFSTDTVVILYSDHGEEFNEHGQYGHMGNLYNEIVKTPLIVYVPGEAPRKIGSLSQNIDIFPTLADMVGIKGSSDAQGVSLFPKNHTPRQLGGVVAVSQSGAGTIAVTDGVWKLITGDRNGSLDHAELYNLVSDPKEKQNMMSFRPGVATILMNEYLTRAPALPSTARSTDK